MAIEGQFKRLRISVVIPARKAQATIGQCLRSLEMQIRKPDEVIIIIDTPGDPTFMLVKELSYKLSLPIRILLGSEGVGNARNMGVAVASGDIIAFIDSDEVAHPYWLQYIEKVFIENPKAMVVSGPVTYVESLDQVLINPPEINRVFSCSPGQIYNMRMGNMAFKRSVINFVGNFDPWFKVCHEDTDFIFRLIEYKIKMFYCENILVYHIIKKISTLQEISRAFYIGQHNARLFAKHPKIITLKIFYINLGHVFLITLGAIVAVVTKTLIIPVLIIMPSIIYKMAKTIMKKNLRLMMRQLTLGYVIDFLFTLGFSAEIINILIKRLRNA
jgi:glycosyltransferase involved in cell wall biosynthesis